MTETRCGSSLYWRKTTPFFISQLPVVVRDSSPWLHASLAHYEYSPLSPQRDGFARALFDK
jgi:hypothetical protein